MTEPDVGVPREDERGAVARVLAASINVPLDRTLERSSIWHLDDVRVGRVDGAVVAVGAEVRFHQWFGGRPVDCSGIWGVGTLPEHRGSGLASAVTGAVLDDARARGDAITALFPAVLPPYRRLGFELAGTYVQHQVELDALPAAGGHDLPAVEIADPERDVRAIRELFDRWAAAHNGPVAPREDAWWVERWLSHPYDPMFRALVVRGDDGPEGFATVTREPASGPLGDVSFGLSCEPLVATTERALRAILEYLRAHRGIGRWARWSAPPHDPVSLLLPEAQLSTGLRYLWMLRILDVARALEARGYPPVDVDVTFAVEDPRYAENSRGWRLRVAAGSPSVEPAPTPARPLPIGALSSMYTGFLRADDAVLLGFLDRADPVVDGFRTLFAGPDPWNPWWF
ncbi:MAG TPA: GNAT family N-acetyltransferase [Actinomycetota bacterium]|nr:GNAT family N-acetyltransferase [Actinomycetota bacterium]